MTGDPGIGVPEEESPGGEWVDGLGYETFPAGFAATPAGGEGAGGQGSGGRARQLLTLGLVAVVAAGAGAGASALVIHEVSGGPASSATGASGSGAAPSGGLGGGGSFGGGAGGFGGGLGGGGFGGGGFGGDGGSGLGGGGAGSPGFPGFGLSPGGSGGSAGAGATPGSHTSASGTPANAAAIASHADPALVDINTTLSYQQLQGAGTGMVLTSSGEILTNNHVIEGATKISVTDIGNGKTYNAVVVGYDRSQDVAVLRLEGASGLATVTTGNSASLTTGEGVVAVGNAGGVGGTPSWAGGSVTALNQSITAYDSATSSSEHLQQLIETNAGIIPGDSGGPLLNSAGQVVGMDTAASQSFQFSSSASQAYSIPINEALSVARQIEAGQSSSVVHIGSTAFLGVGVEGASQGGTAGAVISNVVPGMPAAQAGLAAGDTITSMAGTPITSPSSLTSVILAERPGASVQVTYLGPNGGSHTVTVVLASGPPQ